VADLCKLTLLGKETQIKDVPNAVVIEAGEEVTEATEADMADMADMEVEEEEEEEVTVGMIAHQGEEMTAGALRDEEMTAEVHQDAEMTAKVLQDAEMTAEVLQDEKIVAVLLVEKEIVSVRLRNVDETVEVLPLKTRKKDEQDREIAIDCICRSIFFPVY